MYPFGFGLSYTTFTHTDLSVTDAYVAGTATARFTVTNTGARDGTDIVPVYVNQPVSDMVTPPQRLVGFARVTLKAGESRTVRVTFPTSALAAKPGRHRRRPGRQRCSRVIRMCCSSNKNSTTPYDVDVSAPFTVR